MRHEGFGLVDTKENILANKVTALLDRQEPKDLADVWGLCRRGGLRLGDALVAASSKAVGVTAREPRTTSDKTTTVRRVAKCP